MASADDNKDLVTRYFATIWGRGEFEREPEFVAADCIVHAPPIPGIPAGIAGPLTIVRTFRSALPDLRLTNVLLIADGDRVVQRWIVHGTHTGEALFGVPPSGAHLVLSGINEFRIEAGRIAERWGNMDVLGMLQQLGMVPDPMQSPPPDDAEERETRDVGTYSLSAVELGLGERSHGEFLAGGEASVVDEIYAPDVVIYGRQIPLAWRHGTEGFKAYGASLKAAFPDLEIAHDSVVAEGHYLAFRWTFRGTNLGSFFGAPPSGKSVSIEGYDIFRVEDGVADELWVEQDMLGVLQQIGLAPDPSQPASTG